MKVLVTGAAGQVGTELLALDGQRGLSFVGRTRADLDITDAEAVRAAVADVDAVVNCAAYTAVDQAEEDRDRAFAVNATAPGLLAAATAARGIPLIHISTDYVFDGTKSGAYGEDDPVAPLGVYGASKEAGEQAVRTANPKHLILRTAWVYAAHGKNFVRTMLRVGATRDALKVVKDQHGTPTAAKDIAAAIADILAKIGDRQSDWGTYHLTARGNATWYDFARAIFDRAAPATGRKPEIAAIPSSEYPTPAKRPENSVLDCAKIDRIWAPPRRPWQDGMADVVDALVAAGEGKAG
ncbi:MAG: dTDP-4-dehydrorhamnose reductase [Alphaproteobacteria bacterium]|nr:dTDP-4-dehydrorhamnose reductase [Alphaproteobacteria bacterium]